jgi:predicted anti-sigma-YlaC factor YlaD
MRLVSRPIICERVRSQVSTLLDAEVSELDRRLVAAHLSRCAECRAFDQSVRAFTEELRAAPLESPSLPVVIPGSRPRRRLSFATAEFGAAAMVLIGVLGVLTQFGTAPDSHGINSGVANANLFNTAWSPELELAQLETTVPTGPTTDEPGPLDAI